jgi:hypothetical protein
MNNLSYSQEYFLCAVNGKGNIPELKSPEISSCLIIGGILELLGKGYITRDEKNRVSVQKPLDDSVPYLEPLYETIASFKKPKDVISAAEPYLFNLSSEKPFNKLLSAYGTSLVAAGCADELAAQGLRKAKTKYAPKPEAVTRIIEKVRAEFLEDGTLTDEIIYLAALLDKSTLIRDYFSKVEAATLKRRLKEVRTSEAYASIKVILDYVDGVIAAFVALFV